MLVDKLDLVADLYEAEPVEYLGHGVFNAQAVLGANATSAKDALVAVITEQAGTPNAC